MTVTFAIECEKRKKEKTEISIIYQAAAEPSH
jgi:hypothetical protein